MSASKKLKYTDENHPLAKKLPRHLEPLPAAAPQSARGTPRRDSPNTKRGGGGADSGRARARLYDPGRYGGRNRGGKEQEIDKTEVEQEEKLQQWTGMPRASKIWSAALRKEAEVIFVPEEQTSRKAIGHLCKTFRLKPPNMILNLDAGSAHPSSLAERELTPADVEEGKEQLVVVEQGQEQDQVQQGGGGNAPAGDESVDDDGAAHGAAAGQGHGAPPGAAAPAQEPPTSPKSDPGSPKSPMRMWVNHAHIAQSFGKPPHTSPQRSAGNAESAAPQLRGNDMGDAGDAALAVASVGRFANIWKQAVDTKKELERERTETRNVQEIVNRILRQKLLSVYVALLDAAAMSNNWIVFDRTAPQGTSATAELLVELALQRTSSRPVVIAFDSFERLRGEREHLRVYNGEPELGARDKNGFRQDDYAQLRKVRRKAKSLPMDDDKLKMMDAVSMRPWYTTEEFSRWTDPTTDPPHSSSSSHHPGKRQPRLFPWVPRSGKTEDERISDDRKWSYPYQSHLYGSATHYVVLKNGDCETKFPYSNIAPVGTVCAHGGTKTFYRLHTLLSQGQPTVLLNGSGGVAQAFAALHVQRTDNAEEAGEEATKDMSEERKKVHRMTNILSVCNDQCAKRQDERWAQRFGIPEVYLFEELEKQSPNVFEKAIIVADLMNESADRILARITDCFADDTGVPARGVGTAESDVVYSAWQRHIALRLNSKKLAHWASCLYNIIAVFALLSALLSVMIGILSDTGQKGGSLWDVLNKSIVVLPVIVALLGSMQHSHRLDAKSKACEAAAADVLSEIYFYRARVQHYDTTLAATLNGSGGDGGGGGANGDDGGDDTSGGHQHAHMLARKLFVKRITDAFSRVMQEMDGSALRFSKAEYTAWTAEDADFDSPESAGQSDVAFKKVIDAHIANDVHRNADRAHRRERKSRVLPELLATMGEAARRYRDQQSGKFKAENLTKIQPKTTPEKEQETKKAAVAKKPSTKRRHRHQSMQDKDRVSRLGVEMYIESRALPVTRKLQFESARLAVRLNRYEWLSSIITSSGAVLAIVGQTAWVAFTVALASAVDNYIANAGMRAQLAALNSSVMKLENLMTWWHSLSYIDRRTRAVKNRAVLEVEQAVLQVSAARTGGVAADQADGGALAGHGSADARGGNKGGGDQSGSSSSSK